MFNFLTYTFLVFLTYFNMDGRLVIPDFFFHDLDNHFDGIVIVHVYLATFATNTNQNVFFGINYLRFF